MNLCIPPHGDRAPTSCRYGRLVALGLLLWCCFFPGALMAAPTGLAEASGLRPVRLGKLLDAYHFGRHLQYREDPTGSLTFSEVSRSEPEKWRQSETDNLNFGFTSSAYWFRFAVDNTLQESREWILEIPYPWLDTIELYLPQAAGLYKKIEAGDHYPFARREIKDKDFEFRINQDPGRQLFFLRVQTETSLPMAPVMRSHDNYISRLQGNYPLFWLYYGAMVIMVIYNLMLFFITRDRSYLYLVLFIFTYNMFQFVLNGFAFQYLWPNAVWWGSNCVSFFLGLAVAFVVIFLRSYLGIDDEHKGSLIDMTTKYLGYLPNLVWAMVSLPLPYDIAVQVGTLLAFVTTIVNIVVGLITLPLTRSLIIIIGSCAVFFLGMLLYVLKTFGLLPANIFTIWGIQLGSFLFIALLSIALADKITALKNNLVFTNATISQMLKSVSGDLPDNSQGIENCREDTIGSILKERFGTFMNRFRELVKDVAGNSDVLKSSSAGLLGLSEEMTDKAGAIAGNADAVASSSEQMSATMTTISGTMEQTSQNIQVIAASIEQMTSATNEIASNTEFTRMTSENAVAQARNVSQKVEDLGNAAEKIGSVTEVITKISNKTNLLALNATIEAARAGTSGTGFAVVANEIKELSKQTAQATQQIKQQIEDNKQTTMAATGEIAQIVTVINNVNDIVASIASAIEQQSTSTREIAANVAQMSQGVSDVNQSIAQCSTVASDVSREVALLSDSSQHLDDTSTHVKESAHQLLGMAQYLASLIQKFQV